MKSLKKEQGSDNIAARAREIYDSSAMYSEYLGIYKFLLNKDCDAAAR
jgi:hypothetical protein